MTNFFVVFVEKTFIVQAVRLTFLLLDASNFIQLYEFAILSNMNAVYELRNKLHKAWSRETSYLPGEWSKNNPSRGQCAVTALVVQDCLGGNIIKCDVDKDVSSHFFNKFENGEIIDFTRDQFALGVQFSNEREVDRESILVHLGTEIRYRKLKKAVD